MPRISKIIDACRRIHAAPVDEGAREIDYRAALAGLLETEGIQARENATINARRGELQEDFRGDILVDGNVLVEIKKTKRLLPLHEAQLRTYLNASGLRRGLLVNFGSPSLEFRVLESAHKNNPNISPTEVAPQSLGKLSDKEVRDMHDRFHRIFKEFGRTEKLPDGLNLEGFVRRKAFIVKELERRGLGHTRGGSRDDLDERTLRLTEASPHYFEVTVEEAHTESGLHEHPHDQDGIHSHLGLPPRTGDHRHVSTAQLTEMFGGGHVHGPEDRLEGFHFNHPLDDGGHAHPIAISRKIQELNRWMNDVLSAHYPVHRWIPGHARTWIQHIGRDAEPFLATKENWLDHILWMHSSGMHNPRHGLMFLNPETAFIRKWYEFEDGTKRLVTQQDFDAEEKWMQENLPFPLEAVQTQLQEAFHIRGTHWLPVPESGNCPMSHPKKRRSPGEEMRCYTNAAADELPG